MNERIGCRKRIILLLLVICILWQSGCSMKSNEQGFNGVHHNQYDQAMIKAEVSYGEREEAAPLSTSMDQARGLMLHGSPASMAETSVADASFHEDGYVIQRKVIHEHFLEQQVKDLKQTLDHIHHLAQQASGAYIESLQEWKHEYKNRIEHRAHISMRIPEHELSSFLASIEDQGNILRRNQHGFDVTEEYVDNHSRLRNQKAHEARLLELYDKAETIEDMLKVEGELSRIRTAIERLEGRQNYLEHVTSTIKVSLELVQVEEEVFLSDRQSVSMIQEAWLGFKKSVKDIFAYGERAFVQSISFIPYLLLLSGGVLLAIFIVRRFPRSPKKDEQQLGE